MTLTATSPVEGRTTRRPVLGVRRLASWRPDRRELTAAAAFVLAMGVLLRIVWVGPLWLDEAQSVGISRLPLPHLFRALRRDGSPPFYYLLLHYWIAVFGQSTTAVRALSTVFALAALPVGYLAARRIAGRRPALVALLLLAANPYAIRYATETRMYSLELLLICVGALVLPRALERPTLPRLAAVTVITTLLAYTHYWALYLLAAVAIGLAVRRRWRVLAAMAAAVVPFAPWVPDFLFQLAHTGTPWSPPAGPSLVFTTLHGWSGTGGVGGALALASALLAILGLAAVRRRRAAVDIYHGTPSFEPLAGRDWARRAGWLWIGSLLLAAAAGWLAGSGYAFRYTVVALPFFLMVVARGVLALPGARLRALVLAGLCLAGLWSGFSLVRVPRSQARGVSRAVAATATRGSVVGYCPDQLGPDISRLLPAGLGLRQLAFADPTGPGLVDWVNYAQRMAAASPQAFADRLVAATRPGGTLYLVVKAGYRTLGVACGQVALDLVARLGPPSQVPVFADGRLFEPAGLMMFRIPRH